ncbi:hypothetical protein CPLU01_09214 [Colletotrichum plurivorum]|uniref:Uncharacterized protein n=1 Tax=Colletotrichum plurivorum TaxID=2175906 RepID=A0A8H6NC67_9PEZI|nr:hypothetical protein CPLU01_09214 [Colletotrichum plurivorum]
MPCHAMRLYLASPCRAIPDAVCSVLFPAQYLRQDLVNVSIACPCPRPILPIITTTTTITTSTINTRNITIHHHHHSPTQLVRAQETRGGVPPSRAGPMMHRLSPSPSTPQPSVPSCPRHRYRWPSRRLFQVQDRGGPKQWERKGAEMRKMRP